LGTGSPKLQLLHTCVPNLELGNKKQKICTQFTIFSCFVVTPRAHGGYYAQPPMPHPPSARGRASCSNKDTGSAGYSTPSCLRIRATKDSFISLCLGIGACRPFLGFM
jgi:hypothetical protein